MFAQTPPAPDTLSPLAALVGGHAVIQPPNLPWPGTGGTREPSTLPEPEKVRGMVKNQDFIVWSLVFAGVLLVAAVVFMFFDRWRKRPTGETARDESLSLSSFKEMYENGELTEAEYEKIKAKWAAKVKANMGVPPVNPPAPPPLDPPELPPPG